MDDKNAPEHASWYLSLQGYQPDVRIQDHDTPLDIRLDRGLDLDQPTREKIENIYWENMGDLVKPTSLYSPPAEKRVELFDPEQYYLTIHTPSSGSSTWGPGSGLNKGNGTLSGKGLSAYVALRVCREDTKRSLDTGDEGDQVEVLYIYELQTVKESQGRGLGAALVEETMKMAQRLRLTKVVLTCLKRNIPALRFYEKHGFKPDEIDPTYSYRLSLFTRLLQRQRPAKGGGPKDKSALLKTVDKDWAEGDVEGREDADYRILSRKVG